MVADRSVYVKATQYKHFPRKDDLTLPYLDKVDQAWFGQLRSAARAAGDPRALIDGGLSAGVLDGDPATPAAAKIAAQALVDAACASAT